MLMPTFRIQLMSEFGINYGIAIFHVYVNAANTLRHYFSCSLHCFYVTYVALHMLATWE